MKKTPMILASCTLALALPLTSCESTTGTGALAGAAGGAALGSLLGGGRGRNIATGAILGAGTGALIGHMVERSDRRGYRDERLPYARPLGRGLVESPYYPHNVVDVRGIPSGAVVVEDPSTGGQFIRP